MAKSTNTTTVGGPQADPVADGRASEPVPRVDDQSPVLRSGVAPTGSFDAALSGAEANEALRPPLTPSGLGIAPSSRAPWSEQHPGAPPTKRRVHPLDSALVKLLGRPSRSMRVRTSCSTLASCETRSGSSTFSWPSACCAS